MLSESLIATHWPLWAVAMAPPKTQTDPRTQSQTAAVYVSLIASITAELPEGGEAAAKNAAEIITPLTTLALEGAGRLNLIAKSPQTLEVIVVARAAECRIHRIQARGLNHE